MQPAHAMLIAKGMGLSDTHCYVCHRGYLWCWRCAAFTDGSRPQLLVSLCQRLSLTSARRSILRRLRAGQCPDKQKDRVLGEDAMPPPGVQVFSSDQFEQLATADVSA